MPASRVVVVSRVGYSLDTDPLGGHLFVAGAGLGLRLGSARLSLVADFLLGEAADQLAKGVRTSLRLEDNLMAMVGLEAGHQVLFVDGRAVQDARVIVSLNLWSLISLAGFGINL